MSQEEELLPLHIQMKDFLPQTGKDSSTCRGSAKLAR